MSASAQRAWAEAAPPSPTGAESGRRQAADRPALLVAARNIASNWGGQIASIATAFFASPYIVRMLGSSGYGVWSLIAGVTSYMALLDLGVRGAALRYLARHHARGDHDEASRVGSSALAVFSGGGLVALLACLALTPVVGKAFHIPADLVPAARVVLVASGISVAVSLVAGVYASILAGLQRFDLLNAIELGTGLLRTGAIVGALAWGGGLTAMAAILAVSSLLRLAALLTASARVYPELRLRASLASAARLRAMLGYGVFSLTINIGDRLIYFSDSVVIGAALSVAAITFFAIASSLIDSSRLLATGISQTLSPLASALEARAGQRGMAPLLLAATKLCSAVSFPVFAAFMIRGPSFVALWMGPEYGAEAGRILRILTLPLFFTTAIHPAGGVLLGIDRHRPVAPLMLAEGLLNLGLSLLLLRTMGLEGVAWGTTIPRLLSAWLFWPLYLRSTTGAAVGAFVRESWIKPALGVLPFAGLLWVVERAAPARSMAVFMVQVAALLPVAATALWFVCCSREERTVLARAAAQAMGRRPTGVAARPHTQAAS